MRLYQTETDSKDNPNLFGIEIISETKYLQCTVPLERLQYRLKGFSVWVTSAASCHDQRWWQTKPHWQQRKSNRRQLLLAESPINQYCCNKKKEGEKIYAFTGWSSTLLCHRKHSTRRTPARERACITFFCAVRCDRASSVCAPTLAASPDGSNRTTILRCT